MYVTSTIYNLWNSLWQEIMFVGGIDTSAAIVIWAMTFLLKNPKSMKRVQEEVRNLIGDNIFINNDDIQDLSYLKTVIKKAFRLPSTARKGDIDGYKIPAKTLVFVNAWAVGRDLNT
ncbi:Cytochrome P450 - like 10 [Theobroma cacao]|nr:Cytochrome P450 - like 10 [Theobroma cacao]